MGKIFNSINSMIMDAMKASDTAKTNAYKDLKNELLKYKTSSEGSKVVNGNGGEIPDSQEITILKKMVKELKGDAEMFEQNGRSDIALERTTEMDILSVMLPKEATEEDIRKVVEDWLTTCPSFTKKEMGSCIKHVKETLDNVDGKLVSQIVITYL